MRNPDKNLAKVQVFTSPCTISFTLPFIYIGMKLIAIIVIPPLVHFLPDIHLLPSLLYAPEILIAARFLLLISLCFCSVILQEDTVTSRFLGISMRKTRASEFSTLFAISNSIEASLCLSRCSIAELAQRQEKRMQKSLLHRHDLPLLKRKQDWQVDFAAKYLLHVRKNLFRLFRNRDIVMLPMQPTIQQSLRNMYPWLQYKNCTGITSPYPSRYSNFNESEAVFLPSQRSGCTAEILPDGIRLATKKTELSFIPAQNIRTIVRVDIFRSFDRRLPHHMPLLFVSCLTEEQLSAQVPTKNFSGLCATTPDDQTPSILAAATYAVLHQNKKAADSCVLHCTEKNLNILLTLYPHAKYNNASANWLHSP